jgi:DNA-binding response OmpR family regulator
VDDDPSVRNLFRIILSEEGFEVRQAGNGQEALRSVEAVEPALIILDLVMPDVEGIETLVALRRRGTRSKIIAISGKPQYLSAAKLIGANEALLKPIGVADLVATVHALLGKE